jgi:hypothetical protein
MFPHRSIRKYTRTSPDGQTHRQIDDVFMCGMLHSSLLDVRSLRGADCGTDHYVVVAKLGRNWQWANEFLSRWGSRDSISRS